MKPVQALVLRLRADRGMQLPAAGAADAKWCALFPTGTWNHHTGGEINFTRELAAEFIASWKAAGSPPLPITLHHVPDDLPVTEKRTAGEAEGWIEDLRIGTGETALEGAVKWTSGGKALIDGDRYRYLSPEWSMQHIDRRSGEVAGPWLYGAALLNDPFFHSMPRVAAAAPNPHAKPPAAPVAKEKHMTMQRIRAALRLAEDVAEEKVAEAVESLKAQADKLEAAAVESDKKLTASSKELTKLTALAEQVEALKASNADIAKHLETAKSEKFDAELKSMVSAAKREGKALTEKHIATLTKLAKTVGMADAAEYLASFPVSVSHVGRELGVGGSEVSNAEDARSKLTAAAEEISKKTGINLADARIAAMSKHPDLARMASTLVSITPTHKEA